MSDKDILTDSTIINAENMGEQLVNMFIGLDHYCIDTKRAKHKVYMGIHSPNYKVFTKASKDFGYKIHEIQGTDDFLTYAVLEKRDFDETKDYKW